MVNPTLQKTLLFNHLKDWCCSKKKQGRIIILDPHGEYAHSLKGEGSDTHFKQDKNDYKIINSAKYNLTSKIVQDVEELIEACEIKPSRSEKQLEKKQYPKKRVTLEEMELLAPRVHHILQSVIVQHTTWQKFGDTSS